MLFISKKRNILESIAILFTTIIIIFIFILAVKYLKPIIFGLILAYIFFPIYKFFRSYIFYNKIKENINDKKNKKTEKRDISIFLLISYQIIKIFSKYRSIKILRKISQSINNITYIKNKHEKTNLNKSYILTIITTILILFFLFSGITWIFTTHISQNIKSMHHNQNLNELELQNIDASNSITIQNKKLIELSDEINSPKIQTIIDKIETGLNTIISLTDHINSKKIKDNLLTKNTQDFIKQIFNNPENLSNIVLELITGNTNIFSSPNNIIESIIIILLYTVFTLFFFLFFLRKLIIFNHNLDDDKPTTTGAYITDGITGSTWVPKMQPKSKEQIINILDGIFLKIKVWVRGYMLLIIIETIIYTITFTIFRIPFNLALGLIAGCAVLLPYIGSVLGISIALIVYITIGDANIAQIISLLIVYLIISGIIDQLILYPIIIGNSLGLNALETIAFVLLGGIFSGVIGMILSVPALSIIKYIIPKMYTMFGYRRLKPTKI